MMKFFKTFVPILIKYDFVCENSVPNVSKEWTECRLNVKPSPSAYQCVQITVYPKWYHEMMPHFCLDIDYIKIQSGPVKSRSKENVFGFVWSNEKQEKSRIFIAFETEAQHENFRRYFRKLVKFFNNNCENESKVLNKNVYSSLCNEAEQMTARASQANASSVQIMRISDASGSYEDVVLRPKHTDQNCRLVRSLAAISGLFKSNRESSGVNQEVNANQSPKTSSLDTVKTVAKKVKKRSWNIFKSKKKVRDVSPSFHHFQEPLNIERLSLARGGMSTYSDTEWYDLNKEEMSLFEARLSDILKNIHVHNQSESNSESNLYHNNIGHRRTLSSNIVHLDNSSKSCHSNVKPSTNHHRTANINDRPIHSINKYIEHDKVQTPSTESFRIPAEINMSFASTDSNGYTVMHPIRTKNVVEPTNLIDDFTKTSNFQRIYNVNDSWHLSSGIGSDLDGNTPQNSLKFTRNSTATSDFSEAFLPDQSNQCSSATSCYTKNMQKPSKYQRLQIHPRKLFGMRPVEHSPLPMNVTSTPQNKSPIEYREKKLHKGTPFKLRLLKQMNEREIVRHHRPISLHSFHM